MLIFFALFNCLANLSFNLSAWVGIIFARMGDDLVKIIVRAMWDVQGSSRESRYLFPTDNHGNYEVAVVHLNQIGFIENWGELLGKDWRIVGRNAE